MPPGQTERSSSPPPYHLLKRASRAGARGPPSVAHAPAPCFALSRLPGDSERPVGGRSRLFQSQIASRRTILARPVPALSRPPAHQRLHRQPRSRVYPLRRLIAARTSGSVASDPGDDQPQVIEGRAGPKALRDQRPLEHRSSPFPLHRTSVEVPVSSIPSGWHQITREGRPTALVGGPPPTRGKMTATELADRFKVRLHLYRDLEALGGAGAPVFATGGPDGGYQLTDGYRGSAW